ncbi:MAG: LacI family DNA-binding transcriptional regulator [Eubacteriales bacterium]|nr:LacI family DNA-binding transcriptional regulator [Eubacteriales bacterium]
MKNETVTILDVARHAGVAPGTVSRVIHNTGYIKADTRKKIEKALLELNYIPNRAGRTLKTTRTGMIMLAIPDTANAIYVGMIEAVQEYASTYDYSMVLFYTNGTLEGELRAVRMLREHLVDGLFLIHFSYEQELLDAINACNAPVVLCGMCNTNWASMQDRRFSTISIDVYHGIHAMTTEMIRQGHQRIAYLAGEPGIDVYLQRFNAYRNALSEHGLPYDEKLVFWKNYTKNHGRETARTILVMEDRPTAMVASNDLQALGFWEQCRDSGVVVPDDISLSGMDNLDEMNMLHLSSVRMMEGKVGRAGAEILMEQLSDKNSSTVQDIRFIPELVLRSSIIPLRTARR